ncbi:hypothetical protein D7D52_11475 [Nocardia yunnanensis]|uniref:Uncharacterized protein n=1 Tax=Nocardia yunnanensis TaxID=2382165 RepID=A0A386Z9W0_9NOCA|nr:hypothetical protein [Nocardia yunnanensis]AYF74378.1 hypothetical protein D7D52_11475 [Nocardia yunnanensis]
MQSDVPAAGMLKSYKKVSRWYPALDPDAQSAAPEQPDSEPAFEEDAGPARFPHYIQDVEPEDDIPPVPDSVLRRNHFDGAWSDWMTGADENDSYAPPVRYRGSTVVEFPTEAAQAEPEPADRASQLLDAVSDEAAAPERNTGRRFFALAFLIVAIVLLAIAGGVALYVLNSHGGTAQSLGTPDAGPGSGPIAVTAAYNEMTAPASIGDHGPAAGVSAG